MPTQPLQFSDLAKKHAPWSMSKAELALHCGLAFHMKYIKKAKGIPPRDSGGRVGTAAHAALEAVLKGSVLSLKELLYNAAFNHKLTTPEFDDLVALTHNITRFIERFDVYKKGHKITDVRIEHKFGLAEDTTPAKFFPKSGDVPVFFRGVMDIVAPMQDDYVLILDHKSGNPPASRTDALDYHRAQLQFYSVAALSMFPNMRGVVMALHYIQSEEIIFATERPLEAETIRKDLLPWYYQFLNDAGVAAEVSTPKVGFKCRFCDYVDQCPLKRKG